MRLAKVRETYSYTRELPKNFVIEDDFRFAPIRKCLVSDAFLEKLQGIRISQYYIFSGTKILDNYCLPIQRRGKVKAWKQWLKSLVFPKVEIYEAVWISDLWSRNYFHWVLECLPRLFALQTQGIKAPLLIPEYIYDAHFVKESLEDLQVEVFTFNFRQTVKVANLYVASHDAPCSFDPIYINNVISKFQKLDTSSSKKISKKIYISRKDAFKRKVENESDLIPFLLRFGFEVVQMEKLSFKEQRELMRETKVLISIHGAGLSNLIFMPKDSKVVELHANVERYNSCFYHLAASLNREYYYSFEKADHPNPQDANITVDLEKLEILLKTI